MKRKIEKGMKVYLKQSKYHRVDREPKLVTIERIGNKYFYLEEYPRKKFNINSLIEESDTNYRSRIYLCEQDILEEKEFTELSIELRCIFNEYGKLPYSLNTLRKVYKLLNDEVNK